MTIILARALEVIYPFFVIVFLPDTLTTLIRFEKICKVPFPFSSRDYCRRSNMVIVNINSPRTPAKKMFFQENGDPFLPPSFLTGVLSPPPPRDEPVVPRNRPVSLPVSVLQFVRCCRRMYKKMHTVGSKCTVGSIECIVLSIAMDYGFDAARCPLFIGNVI